MAKEDIQGRVLSAVSGETVVVQSGLAVIVSGQGVLISGQTAIVASGLYVQISGQGVTVASGLFISQVTATLSGQYVQISGQGVLISGQTVVVASGVYTVAESGLGILIGGGPGIRTRAILPVTSNSGGATLVSGIVRSVTVKSLSGAIYIGGTTGIDMPYAGYGMLLAGGEAITLDVNNFNLIKVCAAVSGDPVSYIGVV